MNEIEQLKEKDRRYRKNTMIHFYRISDALLWHIDTQGADITQFKQQFGEFEERVRKHYKMTGKTSEQISTIYKNIQEILTTNHIEVANSQNPLNVYFDKISNILQEADTDFFD